MQIEHVTCWYGAMIEVYCDAAAIGISVGHIAEFYLERWWQAFSQGCDSVCERSELG